MIWTMLKNVPGMEEIAVWFQSKQITVVKIVSVLIQIMKTTFQMLQLFQLAQLQPFQLLQQHFLNVTKMVET